MESTILGTVLANANNAVATGGRPRLREMWYLSWFPNEPTIVHRRSVATKRHFGVIAVAGSTTR